jgi:hypothetical protein
MTAAAKAGLSVATARRIDLDPRPPSAKKQRRIYRTRPDPLDGLWDEEILPLLTAAPGLRPITLFDELARRHPDRIGPSFRRTLERRIADWKALHGSNLNVIFPQIQQPGRMGLSDFMCRHVFTAYRRAWEALVAAGYARDAAHTMVGLLALAHDRGVEAELAAAIDAGLDVDEPPDLAAMLRRFTPVVAAAPEVLVILPPLTTFDRLIALPAPLWPPARWCHERYTDHRHRPGYRCCSPNFVCPRSPGSGRR